MLSSKSYLKSLVFPGLVLLAGAADIVIAGDQGSANPECTLASLKGTYGFYQYGEVTLGDPASQGPAADVGILTADGKGSFTGSEALHLARGAVVTVTFCGGTYEVKSNCYVHARWDAEVSDIKDPLPCGYGQSIGERTATLTLLGNEGAVLSTIPGAVLVGRLFKKNSDDE